MLCLILGNSEVAIRHLNGGLKLLLHYRHSQKQDDAEGLKELSDVYERLDLQASLFDDGRVPLSYTESGELHDTDRSRLKMLNAV